MTTTDRDLLAHFTSIVRTQNARTTDGPAVKGSPDHTAMTDEELDAALTECENAFIDRMDTSALDPATYPDYADGMRVALTVLAEALTRRDTVAQPRDKALAECDELRQRAYIAMFAFHPESSGLLAQLDAVENQVRPLVAGPSTVGEYLHELNEVALAAAVAEADYRVGRLDAAAFAAFLLALPLYTRARSELDGTGTDLDAAASTMMLLATRLDRARADMAAAYARDRRGHAVGSGALATSPDSSV